MMKRIIYYFVVLFCLLGSGLWKAQASYCTQPTSYRFTSNANGTWGSTWTNNSSAAANTYLITHRVEYTSALKPASGTIIVVKNGGELVLNQLQTDNGGVTIILDGGKLTVTQNIQLEKSDDRICAINGNCITVGENFQIKSSSQLYIANSGIKVVNGNLENNSGGSISGEHIKVWVKQNFYNGSWSSSTVDAWYAGGTNPSWSGESSSSMVPCTPPCIIPAKPDVTVTNPTCSAPGTATINPYNSAYIYTFSPSGPTVGTGGVISGMTVGQSYTVTATNGACISVASSSFSIAAATGNPAAPATTVNSTATCSLNSTVKITGYIATNTYNISPAGTTIDASGVISGTAGNYTITVITGGCTSSSSAFTIVAATGHPAAPVTTVNSTATCSANSTVKITGYNATNTYNISPAGTTIDASGVISGSAGNYTITVTTGGCTSSSSSFSIVAATGGPAAPVVSTNNLTNICSATTANLTTIQPAAVIGQSYQWHTAASNPTPLTLVIDPAAVPAGIYYLYIKLNNGTCYSTASGAVTVTTTNCSGCEDELLNLSSFEGQTNTQNIFATNNIAIGTNRLGLTHNASLPGNFSLNVISQTHYPGEFGIQIGHNKATDLLLHKELNLK